MPITITILGCGTSTGVPIPGCSCAVCRSTDLKNNRLRTSLLIELGGLDRAAILVDTSTDLRQQALRAGMNRIDAVLYTHAHADHIFGIDDLRAFNFLSGKAIPIYASASCAAGIEHVFYYAVHPDENYIGASPPQLTLHRIDPLVPLPLFGYEFLPLPLEHGKTEVFGYRVGSFAYLPDCSFVPEETHAQLSGLELLIIDGLRFKPHRTHLSIDQAIEEIERIQPKRSCLIHMSHEVEYAEGNRYLAERCSLPAELCYDGLTISIEE